METVELEHLAPIREGLVGQRPLRAVAQLAHELRDPPDEDALLRLALAAATEQLGSPAGWVVLVNADGSERLAAVHGLTLGPQPVGPGPATCGGCVCARTCLLQRLPRAINILACERLARGLGRQPDACLGLHAAAPLRAARTVVGWLSVVRQRPLDRDDLRLLSLFAELLAGALERQRLHSQLARRPSADDEAANRLRYELLGFVSHELQTPVAAIKVAADTMLHDDGEHLTRLAPEMLPFIAKEAGRLSRLIRSFLDLSRMQQGFALTLNTVPCEAAALVAEAVEVVSHQSERCPLTPWVPSDLPLALCDADRIVEVLINLLANAARHAPAGKPISVAVEPRDDSLEFVVTDHGPGVSESVRDRLFQPFARLEHGPGRTQRGTGLGLYLSRLLVEAHGGRIWVESPPDAGASFHFTVPALPRLGVGRE